jgi:hypothetical protein
MERHATARSAMSSRDRDTAQLMGAVERWLAAAESGNTVGFRAEVPHRPIPTKRGRSALVAVPKAGSGLGMP